MVRASGSGGFPAGDPRPCCAGPATTRRTASASADVETQAPWKELLADPNVAKKSLRLLFLGCGQDEAGLLGPGRKLASLLKEKGIRAEWADHPGGHVFSVWRNHLNESAPMLFQK